MTPSTKTFAALAMTVSLLTAGTSASLAQDLGIENIVRVHGAWADGSGWRPIYEILVKDGAAK